MPRFHYRGPGFARRGRPLKGAFWLIALGVFFFSGLFRTGSGSISFWPGILILIGISMVISSIWKDSQVPAPPAYPEPGLDRPASAPRPNPLPPFVTHPTPAPANSPPRTDLLPSTCPHCGAPVRSNEIKWTGAHFASCAYCGSNVVDGKNNHPAQPG
ncbi:MAG: hypothetical protein NTW32_08540 [Chloroflexi bacterium]|nr:hypothetical protein [Chloroflexota bacterium]